MAVEPSIPPGVPAVEAGPPAANWKTKYYLIGAIVGLSLGLLTAYLFARAAEENMKGPQPKRVQTGDALKLTLSVVTLIRQIAEIGAKS